MKTKNIIIAFAITALLQLFVPMKMIYDCEMTERYGAEYKFRTEPIDPNDPFRGKYITLNFADNTIVSKDENWEYDETVFVYLKKDKDGFARIARVIREEDGSNDHYLKATVSMYNSDNILYINFPFDRYYMEEGKAYDAEVAYRDYNRDNVNAKPAYGLVAVKNGNSVLKDVIIDSTPIKEYVVKTKK